MAANTMGIGIFPRTAAAFRPRTMRAARLDKLWKIPAQVTPPMHAGVASQIHFVIISPL